MNKGVLLDKILVLVALGSLIAFCVMMVIWVGVPDLFIAMSGVLALAFYDFWITVFRPRHAGPPLRDDLEGRPTAVSGKTITSADEIRK